jgi:hypothetical protein
VFTPRRVGAYWIAPSVPELPGAEKDGLAVVLGLDAKYESEEMPLVVVIEIRLNGAVLEVKAFDVSPPVDDVKAPAAEVILR